MLYFPTSSSLWTPDSTKRSRKNGWGMGLLGMVILLAGCWDSGSEGSAKGPLRAAAAIEPMAFLVERVAGPYAQVLAVIPVGADAHTFQLSPRQMADLAEADLFVRVGLAMEDRLLEKVQQSKPDFLVVDLARGIARRRFQPGEGHGHSHQEPGHSHAKDSEECDHHEAEGDSPCCPIHPEGSCHDHAEGESAGLDPHIWLSPPLLREQAKRIAEALAKHDPAHADAYRQNLAQLEADLDNLDAWIRQQLAPYRGRTFLVFHPSFGYFADCYGLRQMAVQVEGKTPAPQELRRLIQQAQAEEISVILVQPQFDHRAAQVVADAVGARLVEINDLDRDVLNTLKKLTQALVESFTAPGTKQPKAPAETSPPGLPKGRLSNQPNAVPPSPSKAAAPRQASLPPLPQNK